MVDGRINHPHLVDATPQHSSKVFLCVEGQEKVRGDKHN